MSFITRSRASSESTHLSGTWMTDAFQHYRLPTHFHVGSTDDGQAHRVQLRFLGLSSLEGPQHSLAKAAFYEILESDVPDPTTEKKIKREEDPISTDPDHPSQSDLSRSVSMSPLSEYLMDHYHHQYQDDNNSNSHTALGGMNNKKAAAAFFPLLADKAASSPMALPPKKRRRHKVVLHDIVFCLNPPAQLDMTSPPPDLDYFLFPHDAVAEAVNETPPFEVLFSFHAPEPLFIQPEESRPFFATKLDEFAAVCSTASCPVAGSPMRRSLFPRRRSTDPGGFMRDVTPSADHGNVVNMRLSNVSRRLYLAVKQTTSTFESICDKMVQLMRHHNEQVAVQKVDRALSSQDTRADAMMSLSPTTHADVQSEWEEMLCSPPRHRNSMRSDACSSDDCEKDDDPMALTEKVKWPTSPKTAPPAICPSTSKGRSAQSGSVKKCLYCGSKSTPMWRRGPQGAGTLCNACGVKWKHGKILCGTSTQDAALGESSSSYQTLPQQQQRPPPMKERRGSSKSEKKRKKSTSKTAERRKTSAAAAAAAAAAASISAKEERTHMSDDEMMENNIDAARNLSIREEGEDDYQPPHHIPQSTVHTSSGVFAVPAPHHETRSSLSSSSHSISGSYSPTASSSSSSPPLSVMVGQQRRHTVDTSIVEKIGLSEAYPMSAGVDAVEAATVLTLLKRS
ncbi:hypothetical protein BCR43DRAFT_489026 [Syncephalastrum racemosum]|uniref:GATA-type domain-containing protein n=1 Tax=Syncephalastrum racemosum TaxID=13706 RepID=A0A1X2HJN1_SYNRA|nr:hypothetical protein BCR43DRAFT_489026 [Syncephalastrum racemosum]